MESRTAAGRSAGERREPTTVAGSPRGAEATRGTASRVRGGAARTHGHPGGGAARFLNPSKHLAAGSLLCLAYWAIAIGLHHLGLI